MKGRCDYPISPNHCHTQLVADYLTSARDFTNLITGDV